MAAGPIVGIIDGIPADKNDTARYRAWEPGGVRHRLPAKHKVKWSNCQRQIWELAPPAGPRFSGWRFVVLKTHKSDEREQMIPLRTARRRLFPFGREHLVKGAQEQQFHSQRGLPGLMK